MFDRLKERVNEQKRILEQEERAMSGGEGNFTAYQGEKFSLDEYSLWWNDKGREESETIDALVSKAFKDYVNPPQAVAILVERPHYPCPECERELTRKNWSLNKETWCCIDCDIDLDFKLDVKRTEDKSMKKVPSEESTYPTEGYAE